MIARSLGVVVLPLRVTPWLDRVVECMLMRRVGGGYMFVHPTLGEHLCEGVRD